MNNKLMTSIKRAGLPEEWQGQIKEKDDIGSSIYPASLLNVNFSPQYISW